MLDQHIHKIAKQKDNILQVLHLTNYYSKYS